MALIPVRGQRRRRDAIRRDGHGPSFADLPVVPLRDVSHGGPRFPRSERAMPNSDPRLSCGTFGRTPLSNLIDARQANAKLQVFPNVAVEVAAVGAVMRRLQLRRRGLPRGQDFIA